MEFKVGDRVKIINNYIFDDRLVKKGDIETIAKINKRYIYFYVGKEIQMVSKVIAENFLKPIKTKKIQYTKNSEEEMIK